MKMVWVLWLCVAFFLGVAVTYKAMDHPAPVAVASTCMPVLVPAAAEPQVKAVVPQSPPVKTPPKGFIWMGDGTWAKPPVTVEDKLKRIVEEKPKLSTPKLILGRVIGNPHCAWVRPWGGQWVVSKLPDENKRMLYGATEKDAVAAAENVWGCK